MILFLAVDHLWSVASIFSSWPFVVNIARHSVLHSNSRVVVAVRNGLVGGYCDWFLPCRVFPMLSKNAEKYLFISFSPQHVAGENRVSQCAKQQLFTYWKYLFYFCLQFWFYILASFTCPYTTNSISHIFACNASWLWQTISWQSIYFAFSQWWWQNCDKTVTAAFPVARGMWLLI